MKLGHSLGEEKVLEFHPLALAPSISEPQPAPDVEIEPSVLAASLELISACTSSKSSGSGCHITNTRRHLHSTPALTPEDSGPSVPHQRFYSLAMPSI